MKNLNSLTKSEFEDFLNSFDRILSDVDGVLWLFLESIPGTDDGIRALKKVGKKVTFVSNNSTKTLDFYHQQLTNAGFDLEQDDIITPLLAMVQYLKKKDFKKQIYVIGMSSVRSELKNAGFNVVEREPGRINETTEEIIANTVVDNKNIGAVIADADINMNYINLQKAATYLKREDVIFIKGATDTKLPVGLNHILLGPGYFHKIIEETTGRQALAMAKPSPLFNDYIVDKLKISDPGRVLFIGDSIAEDMAFANNGGYKKLLVLSGLSRKEDIQNWKHPKEYKPDFYVDSLKSLHNLIERHIFCTENES